jgi:signal transduction histidine kinase
MMWWRTRSQTPEERTLRGIGWRLAALMAGLLCALLVAIGVLVYLTMQAALLNGVQADLAGRAAAEGSHLIDVVHDNEHYTSEQPRQEESANGVFVVLADGALHVVGVGGSPFGQQLADRAAAENAVRSGRALLTTRVLKGDQTYLIYSVAVLRKGRLVGVVQTGTALRQYRESLETLVLVLTVAGGMGLVAAAAITAVVVGRALRPIAAAQRRQRDFVADAAHELRTPLTIIRTTTENALAESTDDAHAEEFAQVLQQTMHLTHLVEDLSLLARADSGAVKVQQVPLDLSRLARETAASVETLAEEHGVHLTVQGEQAVWVRGDAGKLRQLLLIMLDNALKHTREGDRITVKVEHQDHEARLLVRDTGPGVAPDDLPHLFDRFYRADRARASGGTGLGLAIAQWITHAHGGHIGAANAPDGGALFTVTLPGTPRPAEEPALSS